MKLWSYLDYQPIRCIVLACIALEILFTALSVGQQAAASSNDATTIRAQTRLVLVDTIVTDKKGNYITDLQAKDFRIWEDDKEQVVKSFSLESNAGDPAHPQKHYLVLFFDNSTMDARDQIRARDAAAKFIAANAGPDRLMAVVDFGGTVQIEQNFTSNVDKLQKAVSGFKSASISPNAASPAELASLGAPNLNRVEADFGVRSVLLALRNLAKSLSTVPGRKTLVMLTDGFVLDWERKSELTAVIDTCNKANVAIYPIDVRGLIADVGLDQGNRPLPAIVPAQLARSDFSHASSPRVILAAFQRTGGGGMPGGPGGGGGKPGGGGSGTGPGGGGPGRGGPGGGGGKPGPPGGGGGKGGGGKPGGGGGGGGTKPVIQPGYYGNAPFRQPRLIVPSYRHNVSDNQQVLYALAEGTGGFVILNSNDLLGGLDKIAKDQAQYYLLSYSPPESEEGTCHTLRVKVDRGGSIVRSRSGYCNTKPEDLLAGKPVEKELQTRASGSESGTMPATIQTPFFYTSANTARVDLTMEISSQSIKFEKQKGKQHAAFNVLGIAYKTDGSVGGRFSDSVDLAFDGKDEVKEFYNHPFRYQGQFELASGQYTLKIAFNSGGQSFGRVEVPLTIDAYSGTQFSLSALALSNDIHPVAEMASGLDAQLLEDRVPMVTRGLQFTPCADPRFKKNDQAAVYMEAYEPLLLGSSQPKIAFEYRIVDRANGKKVLDVKLDDTGKSIQPGNPVVPIALKIPLETLSAGSYQIEIRGLDSAGNVTPTRSAEFQVD